MNYCQFCGKHTDGRFRVVAHVACDECNHAYEIQQKAAANQVDFEWVQKYNLKLQQGFKL